ncbi:gas vesicle structural protein GvpA [Kitasatospora sp. RB6PN24]|uniref:gas vesicle protein GvpJ n=1 Tax=Kitasatospora humi TaxID=2893891 RepID=UPI001E296685|nr:gas vesicle protein GvpJ [Kitasatospora humi]MCC9307825.1 gas vesicle structural protein GvpA [Kitasatospora humi]
MTVAPRTSHYLDRPSASSLADVVDLILDKGLVIDINLRVSLVGIELLTVDARIVVASVDTYLRFAEAVNRLDLTQDKSEGLPELMQDMQQGGARHKTRGALEGVKGTVSDVIDHVRGGDDEDEGEEPEEQQEEAQERPRRRSRSAATRRERDR